MNHSTEIFKNILIPVDGSSYSLAAVRIAGRLAKIHLSKVTILHVIDIQVEEQLCRFNKEQCESIKINMEEEAQGLVEHMKRELSTLGLEAHTIVIRGTPHEVILDISAQESVDLIVMGKLGRRGIKRILLGSVAERVIEFSRCPVLLVNDHECKQR